MIKVYLYFALFSFALTVHSQDIIKVNLNELKEELINNNLDILLSAQKLELSSENFKLASKSYLPSIDFSANITSTNTPLHAFGTRLQQSRITESDFIADLLNHPEDIQNFNAAIHVVQPILNLDARNYKRASNYALEATRYNHERTKEQLLFMLEDIYIQLQYSYQIKMELNGIKERTEKTYKVVENALNVGYAYQDELLMAELRRTQIEDQILESELNIKTLSNQLNYLCGREITSILEPPTISNPELQNDPKDTLNLNRPDLKALSYNIEATAEQAKALKNSLKPRLNGFISYESNLNDSFKGGNGYMAGLQLSWQIFNGGKTSNKIQKAKINQIEASLFHEKIQKESLNELRYLDNQSALLKARITTQKSAIAQANESLRISLNRFNEGIEKTSDLIQNEILLSQRILEMHQLHLNYNKNLLAIRFIAG